MIFDPAYALKILPALLEGTIVTLEATLGGMALALVGGLLLAVARMSGGPLQKIAAVYVEFVRDTPLLVQLFFLFYVLPKWGIVLPAFMTGVLGLGLHYSAYTAEVYRAGIEGVPAAQWEAAVALNFSAIQTWMRIVLPQAIPPIVPTLGNYLISMFKESPLLGTITVMELFGRASREAGETYRFFEPFTLVGIIFLLLSYPAGRLVRRLEVRVAHG